MVPARRPFRISRRFGLVFLCGLLVVGGCAPVLSDSIIRESRQDVSLEVLWENPERLKGDTLILGGTIVGVLETPSQDWVEIVQRPLDGRLEPLLNDRSLGRFLLQLEEGGNREQYARGRRITVAGVITGRRTRPLNEIQYTYPTVQARDVHLWPWAGSYFTHPRVHFNIFLGGTF